MDYYVYPWPVEIVNQASAWEWLGPLLTFLGSVLLFSGSIYVMLRTNKAGDKRAAADRQNERERDFRLFQRDTLLRVADEVVQGFGEIWGHFVEARIHLKPLRQNAIEPIFIEPIDTWDKKISADVTLLYLIGAEEPARRCAVLRDAIRDQELREALAELYDVLQGTVSAQLHAHQRTALVQELNTKITSLMNELHAAETAFYESVKNELARTNRP